MQWPKDDVALINESVKIMLSKTIFFHTGILINNDTFDSNGPYDFAIPCREKLDNDIISRINSQVDRWHINSEIAFRPINKPISEILFTSVSSRFSFETEILSKGLRIIEAINPKPNSRPLGYTFSKDNSLGFGTYCFTWRNVPINSPIIFWFDYNWFPLFKRIREQHYQNDNEKEDIKKLIDIFINGI